MSRVTIDSYQESELRRFEWTFWYYEPQHRLVLDEYLVLERATTRHKFRVTDGYYRLSTRNSSLTFDEASCPEFVMQQAIKKFSETLTATKEFTR